MPTISELKGLYVKGKGNRNMTPLLATTGWYVWSGEKIGSGTAWLWLFRHGEKEGFKLDDHRNDRAFAVRSR